MIDTIIFDMGNVLLEWNAHKAIQRVEKEAGRAERLYQEIFASGIWEKQDTGELSISEALSLVKEKLNQSYWPAAEAVFTQWYRYAEPYDDIQQFAIRMSRKGYKIYILSNTSAIYYEIEQYGLLPIAAVLSGKILSYEEKTAKPDKKIFEKLIEKFDLNPTTCVFVDDILTNIEAAEEVGMKGIQFLDRKETLQILQGLLEKDNNHLPLD